MESEVGPDHRTCQHRASRYHLGRAIQREVETPLGRKILGGEVRDGDVVRIGFDADRGELTFKTVEPLPEMPAFR
jgi:ATP-dependent Clp protease ATP-binding subunit ClpA